MGISSDACPFVWSVVIFSGSQQGEVGECHSGAVWRKRKGKQGIASSRIGDVIGN